jgi:hypothetical protein
MQPSPDNASEPIVEILEDLATPQLHAAAWATCTTANWWFGHGSVEGGHARFWRMELSADPAFLQIWEEARARCEALAGCPLRVTQLYANGHTYGMGGNPHTDDRRPGSYTLLYYPNPEWQEEWDGQTLFYDNDGEIALSVRLRPNRAVFFDSRILHRGTAPSRLCTGLRVSVAYKLEMTAAPSQPVAVRRPAEAVVAPSAPMEPPAAVPAQPGPPAASAEPPVSAGTLKEVERDGAARTYTAHVEESLVQHGVEERLAQLSGSVRLPGFRAGHIPRAVLLERYGGEARHTALKQLAARVIERELPPGSVAGACELVSGQDSGPMEVRIFTTYLPDLPDPDFSDAPFERLIAINPTPEEAGCLQTALKQQVLDRLDTAYSIPLFGGLVDREFSALWKAAESQSSLPAGKADRAAFEERLRAIAARRIRLGLVIAEFARRYEVRAETSSELEDRTIDRLIAMAKVTERELSAVELQELMQDLES